ncbi:hypothetical protein Pla163_04550 [Planctomycetes bacterium Pla163]|uniref:Uncharacterized protein n=1 Tax=Rohdeia mirabilis TaxID=2528008 RepID=A0A518CVU9_9BACT|nr:hypothetical protein Pla163_04550 [Planctomycetes bacterium Pla163]
MKRITTALLTATISCGLLFSSCGGSDDGHDHDHEGDTHSEGDDHDHDHADGDDHDHDHEEHTAERSLGVVSVGASTFSVAIGGDIEPGASVHVDIDHTAGAEPAAIRVWIGDASGSGSLKGKAVASGDTFHGDAEVPSPMAPGSALWIEVEARDGSRATGSIAF